MSDTQNQTPKDQSPSDTSAFAELGLSPAILKTLAAANYSQPTPIQAQAIPPVLEGHDLLGIAQTGTGKTAAFALPILQKLASNRIRAPQMGCRCLVLSPTRELASQIAQSFRTYGRGLNLSVAVIFGGVGYGPQRQALRKGIDVLVAAPGRLMDHMDERMCDLSNTEIFVLDEADQMLDLGFIKPIQRIVKTLPHRRQNLFFSATMPKEIGALADELLRSPIKVSVTPVAKTADRVEQRVIHVMSETKRTALVELVEAENIEKGIVFTRTKRAADRVAKQLDEAGISAVAIHGNKSQAQREKALDFFRKGKARLLVATDIAARGIDIPAVSHVINFELPEVAEAYVHRIGRTARAGADGQAVTFCAPDEQSLLRSIEKLIRQAIPAEWRDVSPSAPPVARPPRGQKQGGRSQGARAGGGSSQGGRGFSQGGRSGGGFAGGGFGDKSSRPRGPRPADRFADQRPSEGRFRDEPVRAERVQEPRIQEPRVQEARAREERRPREDFRDQPRQDFARQERPRFEGARDDRPQNGRPQNNRPEGNRSFGDRPAGRSFEGNRSSGERSFGGGSRNGSSGGRSGSGFAGSGFGGGNAQGGGSAKKPFWKRGNRAGGSRD